MTSQAFLTLRILSPDRVILETNRVSSVNVPLVDGGGIGIRPGHTPLIAETSPGAIKYYIDNAENQIHIMPGVLDISEDVVTILTTGEAGEKPIILDQTKENEYSRIIQAISQPITPETHEGKGGME